ncbi:ABC transporter ATP-binding protein [Hymenobacter crusticola]|uniref:ABC transporter ATP-binding protein n=1 Tax=Hymenobacter crusticola TaxID=1770526 RepID=A0A243WB42_9BACT|nr:ATP-binding cassette domain-containing protein [Hymenobacter crusticola]OUJ72820.1 ABC transporter ATP-binding protein [Hymenobacter crusticola]
MQIEATSLGKRFHRDWIFRGLTHTFQPDTATAILGPNGSGKSTLLNTLSGQLLPTEGTLTYSYQGKSVAVEEVPQLLAYCAPYLELVEELTLTELLHFHTRFKPLQAGLSTEGLIERMYLEKSRHKLVRDFSSGMKQRLKLGIALYAAAPLLLLDEPTTNLDRTGVEWYREHVRATASGRLVLISSNVPEEYDFCTTQLDVTSFARSVR